MVKQHSYKHYKNLDPFNIWFWIYLRLNHHIYLRILSIQTFILKELCKSMHRYTNMIKQKSSLQIYRQSKSLILRKNSFSFCPLKFCMLIFGLLKFCLKRCFHIKIVKTNQTGRSSHFLCMLRTNMKTKSHQKLYICDW